MNDNDKKDFQRKGKDPQRPNNEPPKGMGRPPGGMFHWIILGLLVVMFFMMLKGGNSREISYTAFENYVIQGQVESVIISVDLIEGKLKPEALEQGKDIPENFTAQISPGMGEDPEFRKFLRENSVELDYANDKLSPLLYTLIPWILIFAFMYFFVFRQMRGGGGGGLLGNFGRSRHRVHGKDQSKVTFANVAGIDEAKDEVTELIEFLKNPKKFQRLGGRIPRGVLLVGEPGCGKTLLAKAIAGEAEVPFFSISGSDFVEMFVGVGASRVRDLFKQAKENSPCIIFLDEIDAVGRKRGSGVSGGGHDEREQTLNAILVEMDGFSTNDQVIVVAATNRADVLDSALIRPGRFDRQVYVPLPDIKGRVGILQVHANRVKMGPDVDLRRLARGTPMFSGADLEAIINEAALEATMKEKEYVEMDDLEEARDKVRWGRAKRSREVDEKDKISTAYHEAGHAIIQSMLKHADPVHKVSIIPRGSMGGATFSLPEKDRMYYTRKHCLAEIRVCFGGQVAEELFCGDISSGAQSDIKMATSLARTMVKEWGMSEKLGFIRYAADNEYEMMPGGKQYSEHTAQIIDAEIQEIMTAAYKDVKQTLVDNKAQMEVLKDALIKYETIDGEEVKQIIAGEIIDKPTVSSLLDMEQKKIEFMNKEDE
ncbi:MAG: ATP-dependent zinc metalloprotease FtsH [Phycisphaerae bacterium]|nr:ATP-dependent zinc metalloprotease FtsH [Phycisphaerae bacterium]